MTAPPTPPSSPQRSSERSNWTLAMRLVLGVWVLSFYAMVLTEWTRRPVGEVLAVFGAALLLTFLTSLELLTRWAIQKSERPQWSLGSLFLATTALAVDLAALRWLIVHMRPSLTTFLSQPPVVRLNLALILFAVGMFSLPILAMFGESLLWLAVKAMRWWRRRR